jgi:hypothetical protein
MHEELISWAGGNFVLAIQSPIAVPSSYESKFGMASIHFICRNGANVSPVRQPIFESGYWDVSPEEGQKLVGGKIYLHQTKATPSYFGGRIDSFHTVDTDNARTKRIVFVLTFLPECKGAKWPGVGHARAWTSGVIDD